MKPVDLITGFLGAGKTSFLLHYAKYFIEKGMKIGILVYDHGAVNIDMPLLMPLRGENCELEMLSGACDADCHRRRFRTKLIAMGMCGYDRVLIEPSGIFDMDEFFDTLQEPPLDRWYEAGNVIDIVDAGLEEKLTPEEEYYLASQAACAGAVVLSRTQLVPEEKTAQTLERLSAAVKKISSARLNEKRILKKPWDTFTDEDLSFLAGCGYQPADFVKVIAGSGSSFQSLSFLEPELTKKEAREKTALLFHDRSYGEILRVKGFFHDAEDGWIELNATAQSFELKNVKENPAAIIVIGSGLNEDKIRYLLTGKTSALHIL